MKFTTKKDFKRLVMDHFLAKLESVDRSSRGEEDDYPEEDEGAATTYESVNRVNRGEDTEGDYHDEGEGPGTTYKNGRMKETNLYSDADKKGPSSSEEPSADDDGTEQEQGQEFSLGEANKLPSLHQVFREGAALGETGWQQTISKLKSSDDKPDADQAWGKKGANDTKKEE